MVENVVSASANPFELRHLTPADPAFLTTELKKEFPDFPKKATQPFTICPETYVYMPRNVRAGLL